MDPIRIINTGSGPRLAGTRITVYDVVHYLEGGHSANYIALVLRVSIAEVRAIIQYIEEHKEEVMAVHRQIEERIARGNPPEVEAKLKASHAKLLALKAELERKRVQEENNGSSTPR
jgi:uncharacterized protein (DUF433 family)